MRVPSNSYIILHPEKPLAWNFRKKMWVDTVTNGCRYIGRYGRAGLTTSLLCDQTSSMLEAPVYLERYLLDNRVQYPEAYGLNFA